MESASASATSTTLLGRLRGNPPDHTAWQEFVGRYGPRIYRWCRHWSLQEADARDVTQNVLLKLAARMRSFDYDPGQSFRGWLRVVTQSALSDFFAEQRRAARPLGNLENQQACAGLVHDLKEEFDLELLDEAMARVRLRVAPHRWEAYRLTALERLPGQQVAERLGMKVATVFTAKSKIHKLLQEEC